jgi:hypothetical protein
MCWRDPLRGFRAARCPVTPGSFHRTGRHRAGSRVALVHVRSRARRTWPKWSGPSVFDPGCAKARKIGKDDKNIFPKSIAAEQARDVSTTRNDIWWNAHSTPSQRRCVFTQSRPSTDIRKACWVGLRIVLFEACPAFRCRLPPGIDDEVARAAVSNRSISFRTAVDSQRRSHGGQS